MPLHVIVYRVCFLPAGEKVAIKKITNVFDHVSGWCCCRRRDATAAAAAATALQPACACTPRATCLLTPLPRLPCCPRRATLFTLLLSNRPADATRILREIKLLRLLRHPDIVEIKHIMLPPSSRDFKDIYVVFELMETDLHQVGAGGRVQGLVGAGAHAVAGRGWCWTGVGSGICGPRCCWVLLFALHLRAIPPLILRPRHVSMLCLLCARSSRPTTT